MGSFTFLNQELFETPVKPEFGASQKPSDAQSDLKKYIDLLIANQDALSKRLTLTEAKILEAIKEEKEKQTQGPSFITILGFCAAALIVLYLVMKKEKVILMGNQQPQTTPVTFLH